MHTLARSRRETVSAPLPGPHADGSAVHALSRDGRTLEIRVAGPGDLQRVLDLYRGMSQGSLRSRFLGSGDQLAREAAERACGPGDPSRLALLALRSETVVGIAEYAAADEATSAEVALAVADSHHHLGIGTLLLEHLVHAARSYGITVFTADALAANHAVLQVFADLGLHVEHRFGAGEVYCVVHLDPDERYLAAVDERGRRADISSLVPLLRPESVAVVTGAHGVASSSAETVERRIAASGFGGRVIPVGLTADMDPRAAPGASPP